jgi:replicative DNA helicase
VNGPVLAAEQALLGAVLLDPGQLAHLGWLQPAHFHRPLHAALFTAARTTHARGHPAASTPGSVPLTWVTDVLTETARHVPGGDAAYAHTLVSACPRPAHAPVYGRMVLEGAIHRTVTEHATRLRQTAREAAGHGGPEAALIQADVLAGVLDDLARAWGSDPTPAPPDHPYPAAPQPPGPSPAAADDEQALLAILANRPGGMDDVTWLRPGDFTTPAHQHLFRCLAALHHRGEPIDPLTVLWEARHRGLLTGHTLTPGHLAALAAPGPGGAAWLGERVLRTAVLRTATTTALAIRALAADPTLAPGRLIAHAQHALTSLDEIRTRWHTATTPPTGPAPGAQPGPRRPPPAALAPTRTRPGQRR